MKCDRFSVSTSLATPIDAQRTTVLCSSGWSPLLLLKKAQTSTRLGYDSPSVKSLNAFKSFCIRVVLVAGVLSVSSRCCTAQVGAQVPKSFEKPSIKTPRWNVFVAPSGEDRSTIAEAFDRLDLMLLTPDRFSFTAQCTWASVVSTSKDAEPVVQNFDLFHAVSLTPTKREVTSVRSVHLIQARRVLEGHPIFKNANQRVAPRLDREQYRWAAKNGHSLRSGFGLAEMDLGDVDRLKFWKSFNNREVFSPPRAVVANGQAIVGGGAQSMNTFGFREKQLDGVVRTDDTLFSFWKVAGARDMGVVIAIRDANIVLYEEYVKTPFPKKPYLLRARTRSLYEEKQTKSGPLKVPVCIVATHHNLDQPSELLASISWEFGDGVKDDVFEPWVRNEQERQDRIDTDRLLRSLENSQPAED